MQNIFTIDMSHIKEGLKITVVRWTEYNLKDISEVLGNKVDKIICKRDYEREGRYRNLSIRETKSQKIWPVSFGSLIVLNEDNVRVYLPGPVPSLTGERLLEIKATEEKFMRRETENKKKRTKVNSYEPISKTIKAVQWDGTNIESIIQLNKECQGNIKEIKYLLGCANITLSMASTSEGNNKDTILLNKGDYLVYVPDEGYKRSFEHSFSHQYKPVPEFD